MMDGSYPPGVEGWMIDDYFGDGEYEEPDRYCKNCMYYEERTCGMICGVLEAEYSETALGDMSDEEYMAKFGKQPDDCCNDHEFWED
jgi:hypothetical protein